MMIAGLVFSQNYTAVETMEASGRVSGVLEMACQNLSSYWFKVRLAFAKGCHECFDHYSSSLCDKHPSNLIFTKERKKSLRFSFLDFEEQDFTICTALCGCITVLTHLPKEWHHLRGMKHSDMLCSALEATLAAG